MRESLNDEDKGGWPSELKRKVSTIQEMSCWDIVDRSKNDRLMYTKIVLKRTPDEKEQFVDMKLVLWYVAMRKWIVGKITSLLLPIIL